MGRRLRIVSLGEVVALVQVILVVHLLVVHHGDKEARRRAKSKRESTEVAENTEEC
jgi:hypothetical protein